MKRLACTLCALCMGVSCCALPAIAAPVDEPQELPLLLVQGEKQDTNQISTPVTKEQQPTLGIGTDASTPAAKPDVPAPDAKPDVPAPDAKPDVPAPDAKPDVPAPDAKPDVPAPDATPDETIDPDTAPPATTTAPPLPEPQVISDINGHWAKDSLLRALSDGYLQASAEGKLLPNAPLTGEELLSILRLHLDISALHGPGGVLTRAQAFALLDEILLLSAAGEEGASLAPYSDAAQFTADERTAASTLLSLGAIRGDENKNLRPKATLSRAEFFSILYALPTPVKTSAELRISHSESTALRLTAPINALILEPGVTVDTVVLGPSAGPSFVLGEGSSIQHLILVGSQRNFTVPAGVSHVTLQNATKNKITIDGTLQQLTLKKGANTIDGTGTVLSLVNHHESNVINVEVGKSENVLDQGIKDAALKVSALDVLPVDKLLTVTATVTNPKALDCQGLWLVKGKVVKEEHITISPDGGEAQYVASFTYKKEMNTDFNIRFELRYTTAQGEAQVKYADAYTKLQNHPADYYDLYSREKVLARVQTGYKGNYTLAWAEKNDYDEKTKEAWINAKGHSSKTKYLIWINTTYQRVNIFEGSQGKWDLIRSNIVGTGRQGEDTPVGVFPVTTKQVHGWTTSTYHVSPVVRFRPGSGLAFHSRKYSPKDRTRMIDASIGFPVSLGCIRMYDEDIWWIHDNIPQGTTVVVY